MTRRGEVKVGPRGEVNLSKVRTQEHRFYLAHEEADGTIILVPAMVVPARRLERPRAPGEVMEKLQDEYRPADDPGSFYYERDVHEAPEHGQLG